MQIKTWQKVLFVGSIAAFVVYIERNRLKRVGKYIYDKWQDLMEQFASKWEGIEEIGNNQGFGNKVFENMMRTVGWSSGDQWCMYFAKAVHYEIFKNDRDKINRILEGNTQKSFNNAKNDTTGTYTTITSGSPKKGDIAIWVRYDNAGKGHAGIVTSVSGDTFNTIEGNTDAGGSREGETVKKLVRPLKYGQRIPNSALMLRGFIRKIT